MNLDFLRSHTSSSLRVLIVSPHPDDEVIGAGARLRFLQNAMVVQVTDGAPRDMSDARAQGFSTRNEYSRARQQELHSALGICGRFRTIALKVVDREVSQQLISVTRRIKGIIESYAPDVVLTVPYEGGHPDHDATAFAVHSAIALLPSNQRIPVIIEMCSYHNRGGSCEYSEFLGDTREEVTFELSPPERELKRKIFDCFQTQQNVLQWFPIGIEKFRLAPRYDFTTPPHSGQLYYEMFGWDQGSEWRQLASTASSLLNRA